MASPSASVHACFLAVAMLALYGCAVPLRPDAVAIPPIAFLAPPIEAGLADRILALDPERITERDVRETLARGPTPHVILLHGGIRAVRVHMESFGKFLVGMGYTEDHIRDPGTLEWSITPYEDCTRISGMVAWYYEHDGARPMIVGHSQGGMQAVKVLRDLAGEADAVIPVWNPFTCSADDRVTIVDPFTGMDRPVVGLSLSYVSVVGAGGAAFLLPNQWSLIGKLRTIPDSVDDFTGFFIKGDAIALTSGNPVPVDGYRRSGTARVRNVVLPSNYDHISVPHVEELAIDPAARAWMYDYRPGFEPAMTRLSDQARDHIVWAADVWFSIRRAWCLEAQRFIRLHRRAQARSDTLT